MLGFIIELLVVLQLQDVFVTRDNDFEPVIRHFECVVLDFIRVGNHQITDNGAEFLFINRGFSIGFEFATSQNDIIEIIVATTLEVFKCNNKAKFICLIKAVRVQ